MESQPSVFLPVSEQSSRPQGSAVGGSSSGGGGGGGGGPSSKLAGGDVAVAASVESVTAGVTSLAGMSSSSSSSGGISGGTGGSKRTRSTSAEGCHRGIAEAVLMVQKGKLPKLDPLEDQVKADYAHYREDVTRRALHILTDELPRRIANFLKVVDVNAPPGTLLVCDDLAAPPPQQELLPDEQLTKLRSLATAEARDDVREALAAAGGQPAAAAEGGGAEGGALAAAPQQDSSEGLKEKKQPAETEQHQEAGEQQFDNATQDIEVLSAQESHNLTQWLETRVGELFCPDVKPVWQAFDAAGAAASAAPVVTGVGAPAAAAAQSEESTSPSTGRRGGSCNSSSSAESSSGSSSGGGSSSSCSSSTGNDSNSGSSNSSSSGGDSGSGTSSDSEKITSDRAAGGGGEGGRGGRKQTTCQQLAEQAAFVKKEAVAMRELLNAVKLFMQLHVPRIEDGNNFGVAIQEEAIHLLNRVEESAFNLYDTVMKYFLARAKLCSKLIKYPNTMDYQMAIIELDRKEWIHLKITKLDLRNNYIMLYDLICKNWQNVVAPKGRHYTTSQASLMY